MCQMDGDKLPFIRRLIAEGEILDDDDWPVELESETAQWIIDQFWELHRSRGNSGWGPLAISWAEIQAYTALTGLTLSPWVIDQIRNLDRLYLSAFAASARENQRNG